MNFLHDAVMYSSGMELKISKCSEAPKFVEYNVDFVPEILLDEDSIPAVLFENL